MILEQILYVDGEYSSIDLEQQYPDSLLVIVYTPVCSLEGRQGAGYTHLVHL